MPDLVAIAIVLARRSWNEGRSLMGGRGEVGDVALAIVVGGLGKEGKREGGFDREVVERQLEIDCKSIEYCDKQTRITRELYKRSMKWIE